MASRPCPALTQEASGQADGATKYKEIRDYPAVGRNEQRRLDSMLESGTISDREFFERVYDDRLSRFTWKSLVGSLHEIRSILKTRYLRKATGQAHDDANAYVLDWMQRLTNDDEFDLRVRFNATLMIGDLDRVEPDFAGAGAVPMPEALPALLALLDSEDTVTIATLLGIRRHAMAGIRDANLRTEVARTMIDLIAAEDRHPWVRKRAGIVLGALGMAGTDRNNADAVQALVNLLADENSSLRDRCTAADSLAGIDFSGAPPDVNYSEVAHALATLSVEVGNYEVEKREQEREREGEREEKQSWWRRLVSHLHAVDKALSGRPIERRFARGNAGEAREGGLVSASADTSHMEYVKSVAEKVQSMLEPLLNLDSESESGELPEEFDDPLEDIEGWLKQNPRPGSLAGEPGDG